MQPLIQKAEILLKACGECSLSSVTEGGFPRICLLKPLKTEGILRFWFSTGTSSHKTAHYLKNNKAGVTFYHGGDSVTLIGHMTVVDDAGEKDTLWQPWLEKHFPNGGKNDPEYCVLRFDALEATIYIDGEFDTMQL